MVLRAAPFSSARWCQTRVAPIVLAAVHLAGERSSGVGSAAHSGTIGRTKPRRCCVRRCAVQRAWCRGRSGTTGPSSGNLAERRYPIPARPGDGVSADSPNRVHRAQTLDGTPRPQRIGHGRPTAEHGLTAQRTVGALTWTREESNLDQGAHCTPAPSPTTPRRLHGAPHYRTRRTTPRGCCWVRPPRQRGRWRRRARPARSRRRPRRARRRAATP